MPQVWLINEIGLAPPTCGELKDEKVGLAFAYDQGTEVNDKLKEEALKSAKYETTKDKAV